ncbi:signal peptidase II [Rhodobacteraceae bacterium XHP0102]|nr:signal peptidase II [Rhodobacteraceae bacterium XHP0102]
MTRLTLIAALFWILVDQASKWTMLLVLDLDRVGQVLVFPPYLNFIMGWNRGINFGLFADSPEILRYALIALAVAVSVWMILIGRDSQRTIAAISAGSIAGGALGNAIDRLYHGAVVDFLNMSCCGINNPYTFNIADIGIFAGVFGLLLFSNDEKPKL